MVFLMRTTTKKINEKQEAFRERRHLHVCDLWPWVVTLTLSQGQKAYDIKCRLLCCTLVPDTMSVSVIVCEIWPLVHCCDLWPLHVSFKVTFIFIIRWTLYWCVLVPSTKFVGSIEFEIWSIVWRKRKWRHNDVISHSNFMKFENKSTKGISKRHTEFHFDQT